MGSTEATYITHLYTEYSDSTQFPVYSYQLHGNRKSAIEAVEVEAKQRTPPFRPSLCSWFLFDFLLCSFYFAMQYITKLEFSVLSSRSHYRFPYLPTQFGGLQRGHARTYVNALNFKYLYIHILFILTPNTLTP